MTDQEPTFEDVATAPANRASPPLGSPERAAMLISFDIDGTLACGDPPGTITFHMVRHARQLGCVVGTGSDRPTSHQRAMFAAEGLDMDFVGHKHLLHEAKSRFPADHYLHIGDTEDDRFYAERAGFRFLHVGEFDGDIAGLVRSIAGGSSGA